MRANSVDLIAELTEDEKQARLQELHKIAPNAIIFTALPGSAFSTREPSSDTDSADEDGDLPPTVSALIDSCARNDSDWLLNHVMFFAPTASQVANLCNCTITQYLSPMWACHRIGRITASSAHSVLKFDGTRIPKSVVDSIVHGSAPFTSQAMQWGIDHEKEALAIVTQLFSAEHEHAVVSESGLFLCDGLYILGATPDGLTECSCCGKGVIEIKTSFVHRFCDRDGLIATASGNASFCLDENLQHRPKHRYYSQVQCQIGVSGRHRCEFVLYTTKAVVRQVINFDARLFEELKSKTMFFFKTCIFPHLLEKK